LLLLFLLTEPHTAAFSGERTERRREHVLAAEPGAAGAAAGREEHADLDDRERPARSREDDYDNDYERDDYYEDRNSDRCWRCMT